MILCLIAGSGSGQRGERTAAEMRTMEECLCLVDLNKTNKRGNAMLAQMDGDNRLLLGSIYLLFFVRQEFGRCHVSRRVGFRSLER